MKPALFCTVVVLLLSTTLLAQQHEQDRLRHAGEVLIEILNIPDSLPKSALDHAVCVLVFPAVRKGVNPLEGSSALGAMSCRSGAGLTGPWGPPAMYTLEGGLPFGSPGAAPDFVLLVMDPKAAHSLLQGKVKLGGEVTAAVGPNRRDAQATPELLRRAQVFTYTRSRGLFAGVSLGGATLLPDDRANEQVYGRKISVQQIMVLKPADTPAAGRLLSSALQKASPANRPAARP